VIENNFEPNKKKSFLSVCMSNSEELMSRAEQEIARYKAEPKLKSDGFPLSGGGTGHRWALLLLLLLLLLLMS
jgi:hypothetical protein